ncbi:MAG: DUF819 family protein [Bacteroidia bacterium]
MIPFLLAIFYLFMPALLLWAEKRFRFVEWLGAVFFCYLVGMLVRNGLLWANQQETALIVNNFAEEGKGICVVLALPLILFSTKVKDWLQAAPRAIFSYFLGVIAVLIVAILSSLLFKHQLPHIEHIAGLAVAVYVGGTVNMAAVATILHIPDATFIQTNLADMAICGVYLALLMTVFHRFLSLILPKYIYSTSSFIEEEANKSENKVSFSDVKNIVIGLLLALCVLLVSLGISFLCYQKVADIAIILGVSMLGIAASFYRPIQQLPLTNEAGQYLLLIFCLMLGTLTDFSALFTYSWHIYAFMTCNVFGSITLHIFFAYLFKIDADTMLITSTAGIFGPPFIPPVAKVMRNPEIVFSGMVTAILGIVIGTLMGVLASWIVGYCV